MRIRILFSVYPCQIRRCNECPRPPLVQKADTTKDKNARTRQLAIMADGLAEFAPNGKASPTHATTDHAKRDGRRGPVSSTAKSEAKAHRERVDRHTRRKYRQ